MPGGETVRRGAGEVVINSGRPVYHGSTDRYLWITLSTETLYTGAVSVYCERGTAPSYQL